MAFQDKKCGPFQPSFPKDVLEAFVVRFETELERHL